MRTGMRCSFCEAGPQRWGSGRELSWKVGEAQVEPRIPYSFCVILRTVGTQSRTGRNKWWEWIHLSFIRLMEKWWERGLTSCWPDSLHIKEMAAAGTQERNGGAWSRLWPWRRQAPWVHARKCCVCVVAQLCSTICNTRDCSPPGFSVHGDSPSKNTEVGCQALLQWIFLTQGSNLGPLHCRRILLSS